MQQYMINTKQIMGKVIKLNENDYHHIFKVMRMKQNDNLICADYETRIKYLCELQDQEVIISKEIVDDRELPYNLVLAFGLVKSDKLEFVIQKACELGVTKFVPVLLRNSIVKVDKAKIERKLERWRKIIKEACEQCQRNTIMEIGVPMTLEQLLSEQQQASNLVAYENSDSSAKIRTVYAGDKSCLIVVGPEGGFAPEEIAILQGNNFQIASLGNRILRCETAAITACSIIADLME